MQEALVESWKRCDGCEPADALVFATIRRRAIDLSRANDRRGRREQTDQPAEQWFAPDVAEWDTQRALEQAAKNLPPMHAEAVTLKIWGGLSFKEIAETTGVPLNTAASRYRYGIEALRETLKEALS